MKDLLESGEGHLFDMDGFFVDPEKWNVAIAERIAEADGLGLLSAVQLELLHNLRSEFNKSGSLPALSHVCHLGNQDADCMQHLFPSPLHAWRVAGLPNPGEEAKAYMSKN